MTKFNVQDAKKIYDILKKWGFTAHQMLRNKRSGTVNRADNWAAIQLAFDEDPLLIFRGNWQDVSLLLEVLHPSEIIVRDKIDGQLIAI